MTCKITLDEDSFKKLEEMIKEKYPSVDEVTYLKLPIYPFKDQDFIEKLVISSWHTLKHFYKKDSRDFIKKTRYSLNKFGGRIYDFERYKNNAHDEWGVVIYNIFYFLIEYSFWDDIPLPDYINDYTLGELNKIYNTDFDVSFYGMRERVINKIVSYNFDSDKLARLYGLIERNEKSTSELAKQNNEIKKSKNDVIELKDALSEIEDNFQGKLLTRSFFMMKEDIKVQILKARVNYNLFVWLSTSIPILAFLFHFLVLDKKSGFISFDFNYFFSFTVPFIALEILLFYYVRISYLEIKVLNTQKLQVEHRLAVCRFIRSYARQKTRFYEKSITNENKEIIISQGGVSKFIGYPDAFESLIFSPIQTSGENIPSALDGVNSIAELAGKIMSAKK